MLDVVCPFCKRITNLSPCEHCKKDLNLYFKHFLVNSITIKKLVETDVFLTTLSLDERRFIVLAIYQIDKSFNNRLIYESNEKFFGVKNVIDSTFVRFYFAKENGKLFFKYRKTKGNIRDKIYVEKYDQDMVDRVARGAIISMTYKYTFNNNEKRKEAANDRRQKYIDGYYLRKNRSNRARLQTKKRVADELKRIISEYERIHNCQIIYNREEFNNYLETHDVVTFDDFYKAPGINSNVNYIPEKALSRVLFKYEI